MFKPTRDPSEYYVRNGTAPPSGRMGKMWCDTHKRPKRLSKTTGSQEIPMPVCNVCVYEAKLEERRAQVQA